LKYVRTFYICIFSFVILGDKDLHTDFGKRKTLSQKTGWALLE